MWPNARRPQCHRREWSFTVEIADEMIREEEMRRIFSILKDFFMREGKNLLLS